MNKSLILIACALTALLSEARAQTDDERQLLETGPLIINPMPSTSQWTVDYTYIGTPGPGDPSPKNRPKHIVVTKMEAVRHEETTQENGLKGELWRTGHIEVERKPNVPKCTKCVGLGLTNDFAELEWISTKNFVGIKTENDHKCFVFKQERFNEALSPTGTAFGYIDIKTRYPVSYHYRTEIRQYNILPPPTLPLVFPEEFMAVGKAMMEQIERATPHLSPP